MEVTKTCRGAVVLSLHGPRGLALRRTSGQDGRRAARPAAGPPAAGREAGAGEGSKSMIVEGKRMTTQRKV